MDPTLLYTQVNKFKKNPTLIYHATAIHVPTRNMPEMPHICQLLHVHISDRHQSEISKLHLFTTLLQKCAINKISFKCHIPQLLDSHQWEKYVNIHATYESTGINHVTRSTQHRQRR